MKIEKVQKLKNDQFLINNEVKVSNINADEKGITCDIQFTENISQKDAEELASTFINEALTHTINEIERKK